MSGKVRKTAMAKPKALRPWILRFSHAHARLWIAIALTIAVFVVLPADWNLATRILVGWDIGVGFYLAAAFLVMARADVAHIKRRAAEQDEGAFALLLLTVAAALASLGAIFAELAAVNQESQGYWLHIGLAIATILLSWSFTHTIFALHYAYEFYSEGHRAEGLRFPEDDEPDYWDFMYFAFVIGMTFQVSDVAVTNKWIRRTVVIHGVISFLFSTTILALTVNVAGGFLGR
jgi:uncharacterized membrane protein